MTIFLTTQYLEEADELAHRVGIIDHGRIVAEGTPEELKRSIGSRHDRASRSTATATRSTQQCGPSRVSSSVELTRRRGDDHDEGRRRHDQPVAVALHEASVQVRNLTLRTPTLDDVFLELTGGRIEETGAMTAVDAVGRAVAASGTRSRVLRRPADDRGPGAATRAPRPGSPHTRPDHPACSSSL